jgi:salicylate hydroxylase
LFLSAGCYSDLPPLDVIEGNNVVLLGDAGHATTPHQGSGAGQAIEDALFMSRLLGHPDLSSQPTAANIKKALQVYRRYRHDRAAQVQISSAQCGLVYEGRGVNGEGQNIDKVRKDLKDRMRWIWEYDTEKQISSMLAEVKSTLAA